MPWRSSGCPWLSKTPFYRYRDVPAHHPPLAQFEIRAFWWPTCLYISVFQPQSVIFTIASRQCLVPPLFNSLFLPHSLTTSPSQFYRKATLLLPSVSMGHPPSSPPAPDLVMLGWPLGFFLTVYRCSAWLRSAVLFLCPFLQLVTVRYSSSLCCLLSGLKIDCRIRSGRKQWHRYQVCRFIWFPPPIRSEIG